jgi:hypothetical protein
MRERAILEAIAELERWQERQRTLTGEEQRKAQRQIAYYESLVKEMKREVQPARFGDMLRAR